MWKIIITIIVSVLVVSSSAKASHTLYEFFNGALPSIANRFGIYNAIVSNDDSYTGTYEQNVVLLAALKALETNIGGVSGGVSNMPIMRRRGNSLVTVNNTLFWGIGTSTSAQKVSVYGTTTLQSFENDVAAFKVLA